MKDDRDRRGGGRASRRMMKFVWDALDFYGRVWCQYSGWGGLDPQVLVYGFTNKKMAA